MAGFSSEPFRAYRNSVRRNTTLWVVEGAKGRLLPGIDTMKNGAALHKDYRVVAVFPCHRRRQAEHESGLGLPSDGFEAHSGKVMTFIDDDMAVISHQIGDDPLPHQALHESDINVAARLLFPAVDNANLVRRDVQKRLETRQPLIEKLPTMDKDQRIPVPHGYHFGGDDGLAECRGCRKYPSFMIK